MPFNSNQRQHAAAGMSKAHMNRSVKAIQSRPALIIETSLNDLPIVLPHIVVSLSVLPETEDIGRKKERTDRQHNVVRFTLTRILQER
jgi:hypothetical protein